MSHLFHLRAVASRNACGEAQSTSSDTPPTNSARSGVIPRTSAALPPITDQTTGTTINHPGTGRTAVKRSPTVKIVVGHGTANPGAKGKLNPDHSTRAGYDSE